MTPSRTLFPWLVLLVVSTGACSSAPYETVESDGIRIWTTEDTGAEAGVAGSVQYRAEMNCFVLAPVDESGDVSISNASPLFWPKGSTIALVAGEPAVEVPGYGTVLPGDEILGAGGYGAVPSDISVPTACIGQSGEVAFLERLRP